MDGWKTEPGMEITELSQARPTSPDKLGDRDISVGPTESRLPQSKFPVRISRSPRGSIGLQTHRHIIAEFMEVAGRGSCASWPMDDSARLSINPLDLMCSPKSEVRLRTTTAPGITRPVS